MLFAVKYTWFGFNTDMELKNHHCWFPYAGPPCVLTHMTVPCGSYSQMGDSTDTGLVPPFPS